MILNKDELLSLEIDIALNGIDTARLSTLEELPLNQLIVIPDCFIGLVSGYTQDFITGKYDYTLENPVSLLSRGTFTENKTLTTNNFLNDLSVPNCKLSNYSLEDTKIDVDVSGQNYLDTLKRLGELKLFQFWWDYQENVLKIGYKNEKVDQKLINIEIISKNLSIDSIVNKIYPFGNYFEDYDLDTLITQIKIIDDYYLESNDKGFFLADYDSIANYGLREKQEIIDDFSINNVINSRKLEVIQSIYSTAVNQLKQHSNPIYNLTINQVAVESLTSVFVGEIYETNEIDYILTAIKYNISKNGIIANLSLSSQPKKQVRILSLLRRLDRNSLKKASSKDTQVLNFTFDLDSYGEKEIEITFPATQRVYNLETYYTVSNEFAVYPRIEIKFDDKNIFKDSPDKLTKSQRVPELLNQSLNSLVGSKITFQKDEKHKLKVTNESDKPTKVVVYLLMQIEV